MELILDLDTHRLKGGLFEEGAIKKDFEIPLKKELLKAAIMGENIEAVFISSAHTDFEVTLKEVLENMHLPFQIFDFLKLKIKTDIEEPDLLSHDQIANAYGALSHFPQNDCVIVDLGDVITFDYIACDGTCLGGAMHPGIDMETEALAKYDFPKVKMIKPSSPVAKTKQAYIQSGMYWGLLGAIERLTFEMRSTSSSPSNVKVLATGKLLKGISGDALFKDLRELVDMIDPQLTLTGIYEIIKEKKQHGRQS